MNPHASIVIPLYNKQSTIQRTLRSVLNQTFADFEVIVVNDGSTDSSLQQALAVEDARIRIITQANGGQNSARNCGIKESQSSLIAFLDADDEWLPGFLARVIHLRQTFPVCGLFATAFDKVSSDPSKFKIRQSPYPEGWEGVLEDFYKILLTYTPFCASSVAIEKNALEEIGGFTEKTRIRGDMETWVRLSASCKFAYSNQVLSLYHLDAENRICDTAKERDLRLSDHLVILSQFLKNDQLPVELRKGAEEYLSRSYLNYVISNLESNNRSYARQLLVKWRVYPPDFRRWMRLCVRSIQK